MSGIFGFGAKRGLPDPAGTLKRMRQALPSHGPSIKLQWTRGEGNVGLGAVHPARIGRLGCYAEDRTAGLCCVLDGVIYRNSAGHGEGLIESDGASLLLDRYAESGTECLVQLSGSFNMALWDEKARRLVIATDKMGQRLLFFGHRNGALVFASMPARVLAADLVSREIDLEGFADLISFGYVLGKRTLFKGIQSLPPAGVLTYDGDKLDIRQYWRLDQVEPYGSYDRRRLEELEGLFKRAVKRTIRSDITTAIDLTGGLDSRCILATAANMRLPFVTHTGGQPESTDVVLARQLAEITGTEHVFEPIGAERMAEWLVPMVRYQGGNIATLHSHPCQHFDMPLPFDAVVQGTSISYVRGHWLSPGDLGIDTLATAINFLKSKMASHTARHMDLKELWRHEYRDIGLNAPEKHLRSLFDQISIPDKPAAALAYISLQEHCRKFLNKAIMIVRSEREAYFPYRDPEFIEALARLPISERVTDRIQVDLIRRLYPELLDVPMASTLIPLSASPTKTWTIERYRIIKRLLSQWFGFPEGTPTVLPNHHLSRWTREAMRDTLCNILYNPQAAFRAYIDWETVQTLLNQHFSGKKRWEHLLGALTVFEIVHKIWVDPDPEMSQVA